MKANFLVSPFPRARIPGARRLFVIDPYVVHVLEKNGEIGNYAEIEVAVPLRATRDAFLRDHEFVDGKFRQYTQIVSQRLNEVHGTCFDGGFWRKAMSLALLRHIVLCYDMYQMCEAYLRVQMHDCTILAERSYYTPRDFNEHRRFFQNSDFGQEQLFSVYCSLFHPGRFTEWEAKHAWPTGTTTSMPKPLPRRSLAQLPMRIARRLLRMRSPTVGVIKSYFSQENLDQLLLESYGRIQTILLPETNAPSGPMDWDKRGALSRVDERFDSFDRFAFSALRHGMPRAFVEDAPSLLAAYEDTFSRYPDLRWVVSEAWIGDMHSAMALAVLGRRGVRHLYNEHNYIAHPFLGNNLKYVAALADCFATLGWKSADHPNFVAGASLFKWTDSTPLRTAGQHILYIASLPQVRMPEINASYGESGLVNVPRYFDFVESFLSRLSEATLKDMVVRAYPTGSGRTLHAWDFKYRLRKELARVKRVDDSEVGARSLMRKARLIVVDYLSTAYLEALLLDVPTIFFWNRNSYYLEDTHRSFFDPLVAAGICHTDPAEAAKFVEGVREEPLRWWRSEAVQRAREHFLSDNIGAPEIMINCLLHVSRDSSTNPASVRNCS